MRPCAVCTAGGALRSSSSGLLNGPNGVLQRTSNVILSVDQGDDTHQAPGKGNRQRAEVYKFIRAFESVARASCHDDYRVDQREDALLYTGARRDFTHVVIATFTKSHCP